MVSNAVHNVISSNYIGTNASGTAAIAGQGMGIVVGDHAHGTIVGGDLPGQGNLISGNVGTGVMVGFEPNVGPQDVVVAGNLIGTDASGNSALGNGGSGVHIASTTTNARIGGSTSSSRNEM